jgi:hypothetical protein
MEPDPPINIPSVTTKEDDLRTAGQRSINLIWERTQAGIAIAVVLSNIVYVFAAMFLPATSPAGGKLLEYAFFLVIGFYFGRTNHARIGDDGKRAKPLDDR